MGGAVKDWIAGYDGLVPGLEAVLKKARFWETLAWHVVDFAVLSYADVYVHSALEGLLAVVLLKMGYTF